MQEKDANIVHAESRLTDLRQRLRQLDAAEAVVTVRLKPRTNKPRS